MPERVVHFSTSTVVQFSTGVNTKEDPRLPQVETPARRIPAGLKRFIATIEQLDQAGKTDFVIALLGLSDQALQEAWDLLEQVTAKTRADGQLHSVYLQYEDLGCAVVCTAGDPERMTKTLGSYCMIRKYRTRATTCLGIGVDIALADPPHAIAFLEGEWQHDEVLEGLASELLGPEPSDPGAR